MTTYRFSPLKFAESVPNLLSLKMFISLDLMLLPNMNESPINLLSETHLSGRKSYVEFKQESLAQLSLAIVRCSLVLCFDLQVIFVLILNLVSTFACYPSLYGACSYNPLVPLEISLSLYV
jgi:hypothetical protein